MVAALSPDDVEEAIVLGLGVAGFEVVVEAFAGALVGFVDALVEADRLFLQLFLLDAHELPLFALLQDLEHIDPLLMRQLLDEGDIHLRRWHRLVRLHSILPILQLIKNTRLIVLGDLILGACGSIGSSRICG